jgi:hypothetical protein
MMAPQQQLETCDFKLTEACKSRRGITEAKLGYLTTIGTLPRFACDDCAQVIADKIERTLRVKIIERGDRIA